MKAAVALAKPRLKRRAELSLVLADDALVRRLNRQWRRIDAATDVLSFAVEDDALAPRAPFLMGDVVLAFETVSRQAQEQGKPLADHLRHLVVHGVLHLLGYDHEEPARPGRWRRWRPASWPASASPIPMPSGRRQAMTEASNGKPTAPRGERREFRWPVPWPAQLAEAAARRSTSEQDLRDSLEELIEEHHEQDEEPIDAQERAILANILKLRDLTAADVMVPRADIVALEAETPFDQVIKSMVEHGHSRLPVYRETLDDVVGMVHIKDLLPYAVDSKPVLVGKVVRKVLFVAPSMPILDLLLQMRLTRIHMALVVDEFGGIDGLVTIEDVIEEIVGEIEDEHDPADPPKLIERPDGTLIAEARTPIATLRGARRAEAAAAGRRGGHRHAGRAGHHARRPRAGRGEVIRHPAGFDFEVLDADPRRVKRLRLKGLPAPPVSEVEHA